MLLPLLTTTFGDLSGKGLQANRRSIPLGILQPLAYLPKLVVRMVVQSGEGRIEGGMPRMTDDASSEALEVIDRVQHRQFALELRSAFPALDGAQKAGRFTERLTDRLHRIRIRRPGRRTVQQPIEG